MPIIPISFDSYLGYSATKSVEAEYGGVSIDPVLDSRIQSVGKRLVPKTANPKLPYRFRVLNTDDVNAFALPGGPVYVNKGLLKIVNDDELASVMGHELGHVNARHSIKGLEQSLGIDIATKGVKALLKKSKKLALSPDEVKTIDSINKTIGGFVLLGYSRSDEYEADAKGLITMANAGYNPNGAVSLMQKFREMEGRDPTKLEQFFSTHPSTKGRIDAMQKLINKNFPTAKALVPAGATAITQITDKVKEWWQKPAVKWSVISLGALGLGYITYRLLKSKPQITQIRRNPMAYIEDAMIVSIQNISDRITELYNVPKIKILVTNMRGRGIAAYSTERIVGGKINFPKDITIYNWEQVRNYPGEIILALAHELAHHIENIKKGSLHHSPAHGNLEDDIGILINRKYSDILKARRNPIKEPWQMSPSEFLKSKLGDKWYVSNVPIKRCEEIGSKRINRKNFEILENEHKQIVQQALLENKQIPEVLFRYYPKLQKQIKRNPTAGIPKELKPLVTDMRKYKTFIDWGKHYEAMTPQQIWLLKALGFIKPSPLRGAPPELDLETFYAQATGRRNPGVGIPKELVYAETWKGKPMVIDKSKIETIQAPLGTEDYYNSQRIVRVSTASELQQAISGIENHIQDMIKSGVKPSEARKGIGRIQARYQKQLDFLTQAIGRRNPDKIPRDLEPYYRKVGEGKYEVNVWNPRLKKWVYYPPVSLEKAEELVNKFKVFSQAIGRRNPEQYELTDEAQILLKEGLGMYPKYQKKFLDFANRIAQFEGRNLITVVDMSEAIVTAVTDIADINRVYFHQIFLKDAGMWNYNRIKALGLPMPLDPDLPHLVNSFRVLYKSLPKDSKGLLENYIYNFGPFRGKHGELSSSDLKFIIKIITTAQDIAKEERYIDVKPIHIGGAIQIVEQRFKIRRNPKLTAGDILAGAILIPGIPPL